MQNSKLDHNVDKEIWETIKNLKEEQLLSGYDFFPLLLRYPLSQVLGRVKRLELGSPEEKVFEYESLFDFQFKNAKPTLENFSSIKKTKFRVFINKIKKNVGIKKNVKLPCNSIFVPLYSNRIEGVCTKLSIKENLVIGETENPIKFNHVFYPFKNELKNFRPDISTIQNVYEKLEEYLKFKGYIIDKYSKVILYNSISRIYRDIEIVSKAFQKLSPKLIVLFKDTYSPYLLFSLLAPKYGTKIVLLQHGLDCENYFLDDVYTGNVIVWGDYRKNRYKRDSEFQAKISVLGNPNYDHVNRISLKHSQCKNWLWITRPHHSPFCYSFSRKTKEGLDILKDLIDLSKKFSADVLIKPHDNDYSDLYQNYIDRHENGNVKVVSNGLNNALENVDLVICEDSTAIIDAMINGKLIILVHFADSDPTLPIKLFDAAPIARNKDELEKAINKILSLNDDDLLELQRKQDNFIEYCVGTIGGNSIEQTVNHIYSIIND